MKKNLNIIQIRGIKGILFVVFIGCCLAAGFVVFPGYVAMHAWNFAVKYTAQLPTIGIIQGILLWGIIAASYFTFRKEKLVVCMRASDGLSENELKEVFKSIKKQAANDIIIQNMIKAREAEIKIKKLSDNCEQKQDNLVSKPNNNHEKIETK